MGKGKRLVYVAVVVFCVYAWTWRDGVADLCKVRSEASCQGKEMNRVRIACLFGRRQLPEEREERNLVVVFNVTFCRRWRFV